MYKKHTKNTHTKERRVKEGDCDGVWSMDFIYLYETELRSLLQSL
jgi:hypothetical protein